jgi:hypothetical protein
MAKRPRDPNHLAKLIVDIAKGGIEYKVRESPKNRSNRRSGGLKGGEARGLKLSLGELYHIAKTAAKARWEKA